VCAARQEILRDLDKAWQRWRKRLGGRPHFKRRTDAVRIYFSTTKHWNIEGEAHRALLALAGVASSVGKIAMRMDRTFPQDAKASSCHLVRDVDQWYAVFPLTFPTDIVHPRATAVGINRGVVHAIADSDGRVVDSPKYYAKAMAKIARLSRDLKRKEPGGRNYHKAAMRLAKAHRKVRRQREHFLHQQSSHYAANYRLIAIEDWSTKDMTSAEPDEKFTTRAIKSAMNRSILDVGWYELGRQLKYKVETSGGEVREVPVFDPQGEQIGISSVCSICGAPVASASGRQDVRCEDCGNDELGDENAARNVLVRAENMVQAKARAPVTSIKINGRQKRATG
jgi:putative transposase